MRRTFYLAASFLFLGSGAFSQSNNLELSERAITSPEVVEGGTERVSDDQHVYGNASRAACDGDTLFYEDFANGFAGNNGQGVTWDSSGTYQTWYECPDNNCETQGNPSSSTASYEPGPLDVPSTASNGYINMDIQYDAGYIWGPAYSGSDPKGPAPEQMLTSDPIDLSGSEAPVISFKSHFVHCCAIGHEVLLEVSTNGGSNWDYSFDLAEFFDRNQTTPNPTEFRFHLAEAISADPSNVMIRFNWPATGPDGNDQVSGRYLWYIDDVVIEEAVDYDLASAPATVLRDTCAELHELSVPAGREKIEIEYTQVPYCNLNCLQFGGELCNVGAKSVSDARLQTNIIDQNTGNTVWQGTSASFALDSMSCAGGNIAGYTPPSPDTIFTDDCYGFTDADSGDYVVEYRALLGDTVECDTTNNVGKYGIGGTQTFSITSNVLGVDTWMPGDDPQGTTTSPDAGSGNYDEFTAYNTFEFTDCSFDQAKDTIKKVCFYLSDSTELGAGPFEVGISEAGAKGTLYGKSDPFFADDASDIGSWVCLDITLDSNGNSINGVPLPINDPTIQSAYAYYGGGQFQAGIGEHGNATYYQSLIQGNFGGVGSAVYLAGGIYMLRVEMNEKDENCDAIQSIADHEDDASFNLGQNRPNPFDGTSTIQYELEENANDVTFTVRDVTGKVVKEEGFGGQGPGEHRIDLNGSDFGAGVYYYTLRVDGERNTRRMVVTE